MPPLARPETECIRRALGKCSGPRATNRVAGFSTSNRVLIFREDVVDHRPQPMIWLIGSPGPVAHRHEHEVVEQKRIVDLGRPEA